MSIDSFHLLMCDGNETVWPEGLRNWAETKDNFLAIGTIEGIRFDFRVMQRIIVVRTGPFFEMAE